MLSGRITADKEAVVGLAVLSHEGEATLVEAVIDTGFDGFLTLPAVLVEDLGLPFLGTAGAGLGDGRRVEMDLYVASVLWNEEPRDVLVLAAEGGVLLGMAMLEGSRLTLDVEDDGAVTIEPLAGPHVN